MTYIASFHTLGQKDTPLAGGKGANLGEMTVAGFPVPSGFVLTTPAYDAFVQKHGLHQQIVDLAHTISAVDPESGEAAASQIKQLFLTAKMPADIAEAVVKAYENLGGELANSATAVAVRSSATAEDLPEASFAGQQETTLNVRGKEKLLDAVKSCWASLWTARAMTYRLRQNIDPNSVSLAVVVQMLVPADTSGILFTANPVNGQRNQLLINATWGLGEAIVSGQVTPDTIVVDKSSWDILSSETATKTVMTVRTNAGTKEQAVPVEMQNQQVLDEETAVSLAKLGVKIEAHYNFPMDIEWAIADGKIAILQARPITSLPDPKPEPLQNVTWEPITPNTIWMRRQIVEHMPEPLSPLFEDLYLRQGLSNSLNHLLAALQSISGVSFDFNKMIPHGFAGTINGYAYTTGSFTMDFEDFKGIMRIFGRFPKFISLNAFDWDGEVLPDYLGLITHWEAKDLAQETDEALLQGIADMATADSVYWFGSARNLGLSRILDPVFDKLLKSPLIRNALPESRRASAAFLRGFGSKALDAQADMEAVANLIRHAEPLRDLVLKTEASELISALTDHPEGQTVLDGLQKFLDTYGHQIYNLDFAEPTQTEDPLPILLSLKALVKNPPEQDVRTRQAHMAKERDALITQTEQRLNPLSLSIFRWVWKWAKKYAPYRENVMFYMGAAWPALRMLAKELGQRLTEAGAIAVPDDIYFLNSNEIISAIEARASGEPLISYAQQVMQRRALREARKLLTPQPAVPPKGSLKMGPFDLSMFDPTPDNSATEGSILNGYAVSTGQVTAPATVIHSASDFNKMQPGTILVCTTTTPAWTPLFSQAIGLVTDVGGALAHGSIVAREYGIPAVMGTGVATERIKSGMMLKVDGDAGKVTLVDEFDPVEEQRRLAQKQAEEQAAAKRRKVIMAVIVGFIGLLWWRKRRK